MWGKRSQYGSPLESERHGCWCLDDWFPLIRNATSIVQACLSGAFGTGKVWRKLIEFHSQGKYLKWVSETVYMKSK
jgi:hypothetical protein